MSDELWLEIFRHISQELTPKLWFKNISLTFRTLCLISRPFLFSELDWRPYTIIDNFYYEPILATDVIDRALERLASCRSPRLCGRAAPLRGLGEHETTHYILMAPRPTCPSANLGQPQPTSHRLAEGPSKCSDCQDPYDLLVALFTNIDCFTRLERIHAVHGYFYSDAVYLLSRLPSLTHLHVENCDLEWFDTTPNLKVSSFVFKDKRM
ncbi:hypothetical protein C8R44DRAFT_892335 [Mycena epipterygia]|nr:hypothetical protein C8R44DRAFT_892335 [Mycena epipterygia]